MDIDLNTRVVFNFNNKALCGRIEHTGSLNDIYHKFNQEFAGRQGGSPDDYFLAFAMPFCACGCAVDCAKEGVGGCVHGTGGVGHIVRKDYALCALVEKSVGDGENIGGCFANFDKVTLRFVPDREEYKQMVQKALDLIEKEGVFEKIVLGRKAFLCSVDAAQLDPLRILKTILAMNLSGYMFSLPTEAGILLGASPELLVAKKQEKVLCVPLAGSVPTPAGLLDSVCVGDDGFVVDVDRCDTRCDWLGELCAPKNLFEHDFVVRSIVSRLGDLTDLSEVAKPGVLAADSVLHLASRIEGSLRRDVDLLHLASVLHPTPAVGGWPTEGICHFVHRLEMYCRGYFGGVVGWQDGVGNGECAIAIRCAQLSAGRAGQQVALFAGAGIVRGSTPELEAIETFAKMKTMLKVIFGQDAVCDICDGV